MAVARDLGATPEDGDVRTQNRADEPTVSIIVPVYRASAFLDAALASIAAQTRPVDEVIVVDDASPDDSARIALRWADLLPVKLIRKAENEGLGAARRTGIEESSGELVALLDADDVIFPDHIETMLDTYRRCGGLVTADALWWAPTKQLSLVSGRKRRRIPPPSGQRRAILRANFVHPASLFSRSDYENAGGFRDLRRMEDWDLWLRMIRRGITVSMPRTPTVLYRIHPSSLTANRTEQLATNVAHLPDHLHDLAPGEERVLRRTIRRRRARMELLKGEQEAASGHYGPAAMLWIRAAGRDRSFRGGMAGNDSSVTMQAFANIATLGQVGRIRRKRAGGVGTGWNCR